MVRGPLALPWVVWAGLAFVIAAIFAVVVPRSAGTTGLHHLVLRWFHSLTWVLLGLSALLRGFATDGARPAADFLGGLALAVYVVFLVTFVRS